MWKSHIFIFCLSVSYARHEYPESDSEDAERVYIGPEYNVSYIPTTTGRNVKGDIIVEKFVDTLMDSEKYLKMVETVDKKLDHLETTLQERANNILKYLAEVLRVVKTSTSDDLNKALKALKGDLDRLKQAVSGSREEIPTLRENLKVECDMSDPEPPTSETTLLTTRPRNPR